jgi:hypothetical protein
VERACRRQFALPVETPGVFIGTLIRMVEDAFEYHGSSKQPTVSRETCSQQNRPMKNQVMLENDYLPGDLKGTQ